MTYKELVGLTQKTFKDETKTLDGYLENLVYNTLLKHFDPDDPHKRIYLYGVFSDPELRIMRKYSPIWVERMRYSRGVVFYKYVSGGYCGY